MISNFAERVTKRLIDKEMIVNEDRDIYEYALFVMFSYVCFFIVSLVLGLLAKIPLEAVIFFVSFCLIRNFAGGIHSDSEKKCVFFTTLSIVVSIVAIKAFIHFEFLIVSIVVIFLAFTIIIILSPVDTENKRLSNEERIIYRKKTVVLTVLIMIAFVCTMVLHLYNISFSLSIGTMLASVLLMLGKIKQNQKTAR